MEYNTTIIDVRPVENENKKGEFGVRFYFKCDRNHEYNYTFYMDETGEEGLMLKLNDFKKRRRNSNGFEAQCVECNKFENITLPYKEN